MNNPLLFLYLHNHVDSSSLIQILHCLLLQSHLWSICCHVSFSSDIITLIRLVSYFLYDWLPNQLVLFFALIFDEISVFLQRSYYFSLSTGFFFGGEVLTLKFLNIIALFLLIFAVFYTRRLEYTELLFSAILIWCCSNNLNNNFYFYINKDIY